MKFSKTAICKHSSAWIVQFTIVISVSMVLQQMDNHVCVPTAIPSEIKLVSSILEQSQKTCLYSCGGCLKTFDAMCSLHHHIATHSEGSYYFDHVKNVAYPKHDYVCSFSQVEPEDLCHKPGQKGLIGRLRSINELTVIDQCKNLNPAMLELDCDKDDTIKEQIANTTGLNAINEGVHVKDESVCEGATVVNIKNIAKSADVSVTFEMDENDAHLFEATASMIMYQLSELAMRNTTSLQVSRPGQSKTDENEMARESTVNVKMDGESNRSNMTSDVVASDLDFDEAAELNEQDLTDNSYLAEDNDGDRKNEPPDTVSSDCKNWYNQKLFEKDVKNNNVGTVRPLRNRKCTSKFSGEEWITSIKNAKAVQQDESLTINTGTKTKIENIKLCQSSKLDKNETKGFVKGADFTATEALLSLSNTCKKVNRSAKSNKCSEKTSRRSKGMQLNKGICNLIDVTNESTESSSNEFNSGTGKGSACLQTGNVTGCTDNKTCCSVIQPKGKCKSKLNHAKANHLEGDKANSMEDDKTNGESTDNALLENETNNVTEGLSCKEIENDMMEDISKTTYMHDLSPKAVLDVPKSKRNDLICTTCGRVGNLAMIKYHKEIHSEKLNYTCDVCGKAFRAKACLRAHVKKHAERKFKCEFCPAMFYRKTYWKTHTMIHTGETPYVCEICAAGFRQAILLQRHISNIHQQERNFSCEICGDKFFRQDTRDKHHLRHFEPTLKCSYCPKMLKAELDLRKHELTHTGEKQFFCPICSQGCAQIWTYYKHMWRIHNITKDKAKEMRIKNPDLHHMRNKYAKYRDSIKVITVNKLLNPMPVRKVFRGKHSKLEETMSKEEMCNSSVYADGVSSEYDIDQNNEGHGYVEYSSDIGDTIILDIGSGMESQETIVIQADELQNTDKDSELVVVDESHIDGQRNIVIYSDYDANGFTQI